MQFRAWRRIFWLLIAVAVFAPPVVTFALQASPDVLRGVDALRSIPAPRSVEIRPGQFAAYGALVAAATIGILYLYRGRAFVVYWILSWTLLAGSLRHDLRQGLDAEHAAIGGIGCFDFDNNEYVGVEVGDMLGDVGEPFGGRSRFGQ